MLTLEKQTKNIIKLVFALLFLAILFYFSYLIIDLVIIFALATLISFILKPIVKYLEILKIQKTYAVLIVVISSVALLGLIFYYFIPIMASQLENILTQLKELKIPEKITRFEKNIEKIFPLIKAKDLAKRLDVFIQTNVELFFTELSNIVSQILAIVAMIIIIPFITFFILKDGRELKLGFINFLPNRYYEMAYSVLEKVDKELGRFVRGWILDALFVGLMSTLGLYLLGIDNFAMIGLLAGIGHLIPYLGPFIGGVPSLLISLYQFGDFRMFIPIILLFTIIYTIDNGFVQPYVFAKHANMHPVIIIFLILIGNQLYGIIGMLLAVPLANIIRVSATEIYQGYKSYKIARL